MFCERGTRLAYEAMRQLGYTVTEAVDATRVAPGRVSGVKRLPDGRVERAMVRVRCTSPIGVVYQPVESDLVPTFEFSRGFGYSITALAKQPQAEPEAHSGRLEVSIQEFDPPRAVLDLGGWPMVTEDVLVRVAVRNGTDRPIVLEPASIMLLSASGDPVAAFDEARAAAALGATGPASTVRAGLLARIRIEPGTRVERFLVFPPGTYGEAQVALEDVETGEADGFQVPVR